MSHRYRIRVSAILLLVSALAMGCANSAPSRYYMLNALPDPDSGHERQGKAHPLIIGLVPVELPAYLDRRPIVTRVSENELHLAEFNEWAEPLKDNVSRVLIENLQALLSKDAFDVFPFDTSRRIHYQVRVVSHTDRV